MKKETTIGTLTGIKIGNVWIPCQTKATLTIKYRLPRKLKKKRQSALKKNSKTWALTFKSKKGILTNLKRL